MTFYITYNDPPSGIYSSQVLDVVKFLRQNCDENTKLISFISIRKFFSHRKKIKGELNDAIVLPMYPKMSNWKKNLFFLTILCYIFRPKNLIARSVIATNLALLTKSKFKLRVIYDGRGAISEEWKEYNIVSDKKLVDSIYCLEKSAILNSDFRIAVSENLIKYWCLTFNYNDNSHVIIPCTMNSLFENVVISNEVISRIRKMLRFNLEDIIFIYSGSNSGWQSFHLLNNFLEPILSENEKYKVLFLSLPDENINELIKKFPNQIVIKNVSPEDVPNYLVIGNYGLLIREKSITNLVASPVKFAEYLACGLGVIISDDLGDYSNFVKKHNCGCLIHNFNFCTFDKNKLNEIALKFFTKKTYVESYQRVLLQ